VAPDDAKRDCVAVPEVGCLALAFDDVSSARLDRLRDVLRSHEVPATCAVLGQSAQMRPETVTRMVRDGHDVRNHSWSHLNRRELSHTDIKEQIFRADALVAQVSSTRSAQFRPPYGAYDERVMVAVGLPVIVWSLALLDMSGG